MIGVLAVGGSVLCAVALLTISIIPALGQSESADRVQPDRKHHVFTNSRITNQPYTAITGKERLRWAAYSTLGPQSLAAGVLSASLGTATDRPPEYGPQWRGFGQRYEIRLTGIATGNAIEASLGAIWGEDPRYDRLPHAHFRDRVWNVVDFTFIARYRDGHTAPAYARMISIPGNNVLSDAWRARSETRIGDTLLRTAVGLLSRMGANAFAEFWPDVRQHLFAGR